MGKMAHVTSLVLMNENASLTSTLKAFQRGFIVVKDSAIIHAVSSICFYSRIHIVY